MLRQSPFSRARRCYVLVGSSGFLGEPTVLERRFDPGVSQGKQSRSPRNFAHDDFAFVFEAFWDLWVPNEDEHGESWVQRPVAVRFLVHGVQFDEGIYTEDGHIEGDFGLDTRVYLRRREISPFIEKHLRSNIAKLVGFSAAVERTAASAGECCGRSQKKTWRRS